MTITPKNGPGRAVEVLYDRGPSVPPSVDRWVAGSGYLIGGQLVLTAAHVVDHRQGLGDDERVLVRTVPGTEYAADVLLVCDRDSEIDLALLKIVDSDFTEVLPPAAFARVDRDSSATVEGCWAVGFPQFGEADPVLEEGSRRDTWHIHGHILPGGKLRAGLLALQVNDTPRPLPDGSLAGSEWQGMSGAVVFVSDLHVGELAVGVVVEHHRPEGESALTVTPITALAGLPAAAQWWQQLGVTRPGQLPVLPPPPVLVRGGRASADQAWRSHWDPRARGVERAARPGWFFTGRRRALGELVGWLCAPPERVDPLRVVTGGPGSGKSAVLARLVTLSDPAYRAAMPVPLTADDPVFALPAGTIDLAVHL
ncbi:serine protease, partial [Frankia sp. Cas4]|uniref:serine protease n=1 Tax=Frankia sp. Cas4 TaxID=3073927 RepID=UPI002AD3BE20